jgi:TolA-binding protein
MEQKALAREYSYRRKEQFQVPLAFGVGCLAAALLLPPPRLRRRSGGSRDAAAARIVALGVLLLLAAARTQAQALSPAGPPAAPPGPPADTGPQAPAVAPTGEQPARHATALDEILLRAKRATGEGRAQYDKGNHPQALSAFERAAQARPQDPAVRFNVADGLYKNGRYDEAAALYKALGADERSRLAVPSRFNLGNTLYQKKDYPGAVKAYRDALRLAQGDQDTRRNLELALRALKEQQDQQKRQQEQNQQQQKDEQKQDQNKKQDQKNQQEKQQQGQQQQQQQQPGEQKQQQQKQPQTAEEKADQRFRQEAGMPKERAMQLLDALQQNEKAEQKKLLAEKRAQRKTGRDW